MAERLAHLAVALDDPGTDVAQTLQRLADDAAAATSSFAGMSVSVRIAGRSTTITALVDSTAVSDVTTSLRIPLESTGGVAEEAHVILFATQDGAFVDTAADLSWLTGQPLTALVLDQDVAHLPQLLAKNGFSTDRAIDQAAGVMIAEGRTVEQAYAELARRAAASGGSVGAVALEILAALDATASTPETG